MIIGQYDNMDTGKTLKYKHTINNITRLWQHYDNIIITCDYDNKRIW